MPTFHTCLHLSPLAFGFAPFCSLVHALEEYRKNISCDESEEVWKFVVFGADRRRLLTLQLIIFDRGDKLIRGTSKKSEHQAYLVWLAFREHL